MKIDNLQKLELHIKEHLKLDVSIKEYGSGYKVNNKYIMLKIFIPTVDTIDAPTIKKFEELTGKKFATIHLSENLIVVTLV